MKLFNALLLLVLLALPVFGQGQQPGRDAYMEWGYSPTLVSGVTNRLTADATNFPSVILDCRRYDEIALQTQFRGLGLGSQPMRYLLRKSLDATNWASHGTWTVAQNTTNAVVDVTNIYVGAVGFLQIYAVENGSTTNVMTNHFLYFTPKPFRQGFK
jgi:hypothetical protein